VRVVFPSNAIDAAGLLRTSIRCADPVLFLEHKHLYRQTYNKGAYPGSEFMIPFGKGSLRREGTDVVVLTWGALVQRSLLAAQQAEKDGISAAVFDLRTIVPYDWDGIAKLVKATSRVVIVHEDQLTCGFGAEIAARISDELFEYLDAPIKRVAAMDCPVAYCPDLEEVILPQSSDVLQAIRESAKY
jgi:2-oxoisovalerate dehydrogenase E1 component